MSLDLQPLEPLTSVRCCSSLLLQLHSKVIPTLLHTTTQIWAVMKYTQHATYLQDIRPFIHKTPQGVIMLELIISHQSFVLKPTYRDQTPLGQGSEWSCVYGFSRDPYTHKHNIALCPHLLYSPSFACERLNDVIQHKSKVNSMSVYSLAPIWHASDHRPCAGCTGGLCHVGVGVFHLFPNHNLQTL